MISSHNSSHAAKRGPGGSSSIASAPQLQALVHVLRAAVHLAIAAKGGWGYGREWTTIVSESIRSWNILGLVYVRDYRELCFFFYVKGRERYLFTSGTALREEISISKNAKTHLRSAAKLINNLINVLLTSPHTLFILPLKLPHRKRGSSTILLTLLEFKTTKTFCTSTPCTVCTIVFILLLGAVETDSPT